MGRTITKHDGSDLLVNGSVHLFFPSWNCLPYLVLSWIKHLVMSSVPIVEEQIVECHRENFFYVGDVLIKGHIVS